MPAVNANGVPVLITAHPHPLVPAKDTRLFYPDMRNDLAKQLVILGSLQAALGALSIILEAVSVIVSAQGGIFSLAFLGHGFWIGILFVVSGALGIASGIQKGKCQVLSFIVLSIVSASVAALLLDLALLSAFFYTINFSFFIGFQRSYTPVENAGVAMESLLAIIAVAEAIVAIWSSVICCKIGACCSDCAGGCCCPPPANSSQIVTAGHLYSEQPHAAKQSFDKDVDYDQQQPVRIVNQQLFYPTSSSKQKLIDSNDPLQMGHDNSDVELEEP